jgi:hypothetical protein
MIAMETWSYSLSQPLPLQCFDALLKLMTLDNREECSSDSGQGSRDFRVQRACATIVEDLLELVG